MGAKSIGTWLGNRKVSGSSPGETKCYRGVPEQGTAPWALYIMAANCSNTRMGAETFGAAVAQSGWDLVFEPKECQITSRLDQIWIRD